MKNTLAILIVVTLIVTQASPLFADGLSAKSILSEINTIGSRKACNSLYNNAPRWNEILRHIASGGNEWLQVAVSLKKGADAGASNMLILAVGEALENDPEAVFRTTTREIPVSAICGGPDIDDPRYNSYKLSIQAINRRIASVSSLEKGKMSTQINECLGYLQDSKKGIASFYEVNNTDR